MPLVIATGNRGKLEELRRLLPDNLRLLTAADVGVALPPETGSSYVENALIKARAVAAAGYAGLADDSGLEIDALSGAPGVRSARFAGPDATDADNNRKVLRLLNTIPPHERRARFRSVVVLVTPSGDAIVAEGRLEGRIAGAERGSFGFGYDPLFELADPDTPEVNGHTLAELPSDCKNEISHRARAVRALLAELEARGLSLATVTRD